MTQLDLFPSETHLHCIDSSQNKHRFYRMTLQPTLFGDWALMREWGRIGGAGRLKTESFNDPTKALRALTDMIQKKQRRGYERLV